MGAERWCRKPRTKQCLVESVFRKIYWIERDIESKIQQPVYKKKHIVSFITVKDMFCKWTKFHKKVLQETGMLKPEISENLTCYLIL